MRLSVNYLFQLGDAYTGNCARGEFRDIAALLVGSIAISFYRKELRV